MAKNKSKTTITIDSPYADYAFYQCLYSRARSFKFLEAEGAVFMMEHLMTRAPSLRKRPLDIVEFLAGAGEYEQFIRAEARFTIGKYVGIDAIRPPNAKTELLVGPVETTFPAWKADAVLAMFYSASSILGTDGKPSPTALLRMAQADKAIQGRESSAVQMRCSFDVEETRVWGCSPTPSAEAKAMFAASPSSAPSSRRFTPSFSGSMVGRYSMVTSDAFFFFALPPAR